MKTTTMTNNNSVDVATEATQFGMKVGFVMAALIGVWGLSCLIGGLVVAGPAGLVAGFFTAIGI